MSLDLSPFVSLHFGHIWNILLQFDINSAVALCK